MDKQHVSFTYKDYRHKGNNMHKMMTLDTHEFIRRFMLHVLPNAFHRIRHYGLLASPTKLKHARRLLNMAEPKTDVEPSEKSDEPAPFECRKCHSPLHIMAIREPVYLPRATPMKTAKE
ncbi:transposase [Glaciecola sp. SC05]|uniref:transposase n=1 Tax=Glaciecola sp. SC05 TaxID=1987355 RepID=UPI0035296B29